MPCRHNSRRLACSRVWESVSPGGAATVDTADRVAGALTAYACGDALGLPWENRPLDGVGPTEIEALPARDGWDRGATSDDTALTLLVARHLVARRGAGDARAFLGALAAEADSIHGLGPSTRRAIEHFRTAGEPPSGGGTTNGAPMRA